MSPTQRKRLLLVLLVVAVAGIATALVATALQRNIAYLYTPAEVKAGKVAPDARFRLGGMVAKGSFKRDPGAMLARRQPLKRPCSRRCGRGRAGPCRLPTGSRGTEGYTR